MNSVLLKRDLNLFVKAVERKRKSWRQFLAVAIQGKVVLPTNVENLVHLQGIITTSTTIITHTSCSALDFA